MCGEVQHGRVLFACFQYNNSSKVLTVSGSLPIDYSAIWKMKIRKKQCTHEIC